MNIKLTGSGQKLYQHRNETTAKEVKTAKSVGSQDDSVFFTQWSELRLMPIKGIIGDLPFMSRAILLRCGHSQSCLKRMKQDDLYGYRGIPPDQFFFTGQYWETPFITGSI